MKKGTGASFNLERLSRRDFIKKSSLGTLGLAVASNLPGKMLPSIETTSGSRSKVVLIRHSKVIDESGRIQLPLLQKMLDQAVVAFSGENNIGDAWSKYFTPDDVVGLKVNSLGVMDLRGSDLLQHFPAITNAIAAGLKKAGIKEQNIIVWDRSEEELSQASFSINHEATSIRVIGNKKSRRGPEGDFNPKAYPVGKSSSRISNILANLCTSMINIPIPKTHSNAVFTCSLKNHYGTIDNPSEFHSNACTNPGIPEVNTIPIIRDKQKLIVCDAMLLAIEGGPRWNRRFTKPYGGILIGTDPVAVDTVSLEILDKKRLEDGMESIVARVPHIPLAAELGVGTDNVDNIELVKLELG